MKIDISIDTELGTLTVMQDGEIKNNLEKIDVQDVGVQINGTRIYLLRGDTAKVYFDDVQVKMILAGAIEAADLKNQLTEGDLGE